MKNFAKAAKSMLIFCFAFMMIGCIWSVHQAEAKTKTIQKGITYDAELEEVYMDISKLTPEEGKKALEQLSTGKYGSQSLAVRVKASGASNAEKKYLKWGKAFQNLKSNKYRLLPYSGDIETRKRDKGYYVCYDIYFPQVNNYYYLERYIDNIFAYQEAEENLYDCSTGGYLENFTFAYTDPAGQKHDAKVYMDYMSISAESVYSEILSREQFLKASDAVKVAFLLVPRKHFTTYELGTLRSDRDMKALAEKRWKGKCGDFSTLSYWLVTPLSYDIQCQGGFKPNHSTLFVRAKNSDGQWEYFQTDNQTTYLGGDTPLKYEESPNEKYSFLPEAFAYLSSSPVHEITEISLEYNVKKAISQGCLDSSIERTASRAYKDGKFRGNDTITYTFTNQNENTYGYPEFTGTYPSR